MLADEKRLEYEKKAKKKKKELQRERSIIERRLDGVRRWRLIREKEKEKEGRGGV